MNFSEALNLIKDGRSLARNKWNGKGQSVQIQMPDINSKMTVPYIYINTVEGSNVPWLASQTDLLADDWFVVGGDGEKTAPALTTESAHITVSKPTDGRVVRTKSSGDRVYYLNETKKSRQWVYNPEVLESLGFEMSDVAEIDDNELLKYSMGPALLKPVEKNANA